MLFYKRSIRNVSSYMVRYNSTAHIDVTAKSFVTERVRIRGTGLQPNCNVTIQGKLICPSEKLDFQSFAHIRTSNNGCFDLATSESVGGTYTGVDDMGLYWSMTPQDGSYQRVQMTNAATPLTYTFKLFSGHISTFDTDEKLLCSTSGIRTFLPDGVSREVVKSGNVRGTLFVPPGDGPFPAIITLFGGNKRRHVIEDVAAMLSDLGYATLALAYFGVPDLPKTYTNEPLKIEYFEEALKFLASHDKIDERSLCVHGVSKGAEVALAIMSHLVQVKVVSCINGCVASVGTQTVYNGNATEQLRRNLLGVRVTKFFPKLTISIKNVLINPMRQPGAIHAFEKSRADLMMIAGLDDENWNSGLMVDIAKAKMDAVGKRNYKILKFSEMGHFADAPFMPVCTISPHPLFPPTILLCFGGGNQKMHAYYQEKTWQEIFSFYKGLL